MGPLGSSQSRHSPNNPIISEAEHIISPNSSPNLSPIFDTRKEAKNQYELRLPRELIYSWFQIAFLIVAELASNKTQDLNSTQSTRARRTTEQWRLERAESRTSTSKILEATTMDPVRHPFPLRHLRQLVLEPEYNGKPSFFLRPPYEAASAAAYPPLAADLWTVP